MGDFIRQMNNLNENAVVYYTVSDLEKVQRSMNFGEPYAVTESEEIYGIQNPDKTVKGAAMAYFDSLTGAVDKRVVYFNRQYDNARQKYEDTIDFVTMAQSGSKWEELPDRCDTTFFRSTRTRLTSSLWRSQVVNGKNYPIDVTPPS